MGSTRVGLHTRLNPSLRTLESLGLGSWMHWSLHTTGRARFRVKGLGFRVEGFGLRVFQVWGIRASTTKATLSGVLRNSAAPTPED